MYKKEYLYIGLIVIIVTSLAVFIAGKSPKIVYQYPEERITFDPGDFVIHTDDFQLTVGQTSWEETMKLLPEGNKLGISTIYHPADLPMYLTFSEDEDILIAAHIEGAGIATARDLEVGGPAAEVLQKYGENYIRISEKDAAETDFDMLYGKADGNTIIFQIKNNLISKIIVQHTVN